MSFRGQTELKQLVTSLETTHWCPYPRDSHSCCQREAVLGVTPLICPGMQEIRHCTHSAPQTNEFPGMQTLKVSRSLLRCHPNLYFPQCRSVLCSPRGRWGIRQGAGGSKGTCYLLTVFKMSQLQSTLQQNLVSETSALLCEMTFLVCSQPEKTVSEVISSASARNDWGKEKKKSITV